MSKESMTGINRNQFGLKIILLVILLGVLFLAIGVTLTIGSARLGLGRVLAVVLGSNPGIGSSFNLETTTLEQLIVLTIRLPRILLSVFVGGALAAAGVVFQGLFHNPMAEPYVMGVSSGAALGATIAFVLDWDITVLGLSSVPVMAFIGGLTTTFLVVNLGRVGRKVPLTYVLLAGIAVGSFMSAITSLLMVFNREEMQQVVFWLMGGFSGRGWAHIQAALPYMILGLVVICFHLQELNIISLGDEKAHQLGVDVDRVQARLMAAASLVAASAVSVSGIIGFVGLIIPHVVRLLIGPDHRFVFPTAILAGGLFLLLADTLARTLLSPMEIPVGVITSLAGAPFFLYLLHRSKHGFS